MRDDDVMGEDPDTECVQVVIETENVIDAVRSHRLLWDPADDLYTAKGARRRAWNDICRTLITDWDKFDEHDQNDVERKVQQRWRTARDCFVKSRAAHLSPRATRRDKALRAYGHYKRLSFLEETLRTPGGVSLPRAESGVTRRALRRRATPGAGTPPAPTPASLDDDDVGERYGDEDGTLSVFERRLLATLASRQRSPLERDDEHFFRSLAPMLAMLDHGQKLQFRSSVLEELQRRYRDRDRDHLATYTYVPPPPGPSDEDEEPPDHKYRPDAHAATDR